MNKKGTQNDYNKAQLTSLFKKIIIGSILILFVGFVAYAALLLLMLMI